MHLADPDGGGSELLDIEAIDVTDGHYESLQGDRGTRPMLSDLDESIPLWSNDAIRVDGRTIAGTGQRQLWETYRVEKAKTQGRKRVRTKGPTKEQQRRGKDAARQSRKRHLKMEERIAKLAKTDRVAARKLRAKSEKFKAAKARARKKK